MKKINEIIESLKKWSEKRIISKDNGFYHQTFLLKNKEHNFKNPFSFELPEDLCEWWNEIEFAELFKDIDYGQSGLKILSEAESCKITKKCIAERPLDFAKNDVVIGSFIGDLDLLVISCEYESFGNISVSDPIDKKKDWYKVSSSFTEFLDLYLQEEGEKFWE